MLEDMQAARVLGVLIALSLGAPARAQLNDGGTDGGSQGWLSPLGAPAKASATQPAPRPKTVKKPVKKVVRKAGTGKKVVKAKKAKTRR